MGRRRRPEPALQGTPAGPGGVLLPGTIGWRGCATARRPRGNRQISDTLRTAGPAPGTGGNGGGTMTTDEFALYDAAYVLGALSPADRRAFEEHLQSCPACASSVAELAGLPGLMSRVSIGQLTAEPEPVPETLLPRLARAVRRERRQRRLAVGVAAAAAACLITAGGLAVTRSDAPARPPVTASIGSGSANLAF